MVRACGFPCSLSVCCGDLLVCARCNICTKSNKYPCPVAVAFHFTPTTSSYPRWWVGYSCRNSYQEKYLITTILISTWLTGWSVWETQTSSTWKAFIFKRSEKRSSMIKDLKMTTFKFNVVLYSLKLIFLIKFCTNEQSKFQ